MAISNTTGYLEVLSEGADSAAAIFAMTLPDIAIVGESMAVIVFAAAVVGFSLTWMGIPIGITNTDSIRSHIGIAVIIFALLFPAKMISQQEIQDRIITPQIHSASEEGVYKVGLGVYVLVKLIPAFLDNVSRVSNHIAGGSGKDFIAANAIILDEMTSKESLESLGKYYTANTINIRQKYVKQCTAKLNKYLKLNKVTKDDKDAVLENEYLRGIEKVPENSWKAVGLMGGSTLGLVKDPFKLEEMLERQSKSNDSGIVSFVTGMFIDDNPYDHEVYESIEYLKKLELGKNFFPNGVVIDAPRPDHKENGLGDLITETILGDSYPEGSVLKVSELPGFHESVIESDAHEKHIYSDWWNQYYTESGNQFNAINCYQAYLIANTAMYYANLANQEHIANHSPTMSKLFYRSGSLLNDGDNSFENVTDIIEETKESSFLTMTMISNEVLQTAYNKQEEEYLSNQDKSWFELGEDLVDSIANGTKNLLNSSVITAVEGMSLFKQSYIQDVQIPTIYAGAILLIAFLLVVAPVISSISLLLPGNVESNFAFFKIILFLTTFLIVLSLYIGLHEQLSRSVMNAMATNTAFYVSKPSAQLASMVKALQWSGMFAIFIAAAIAYFVVFGRYHMTSPSVPGGSAPKPPSPKPGGGSSNTSNDFNVDFNLGSTPGPSIQGGPELPSPAGAPALPNSPMTPSPRSASNLAPGQIKHALPPGTVAGSLPPLAFGGAALQKMQSDSLMEQLNDKKQGENVTKEQENLFGSNASNEAKTKKLEIEESNVGNINSVLSAPSDDTDLSLSQDNSLNSGNNTITEQSFEEQHVSQSSSQYQQGISLINNVFSDEAARVMDDKMPIFDQNINQVSGTEYSDVVTPEEKLPSGFNYDSMVSSIQPHETHYIENEQLPKFEPYDSDSSNSMSNDPWAEYDAKLPGFNAPDRDQ